ncbi:MAG: RimK family alpha-L-glutamate ligase [Actinomycetota bacterium]
MDGVIALVTIDEARHHDTDLHRLADALTRAGATVELVNWDDAAADWKRFVAAIVRSPWDYHWRLPEFLAWAERVSRETQLFNSAEVLRWNTDKVYLRDAVAFGVPVIPTEFVTEDVGVDAVALPRDVVVKPTVSAGSNDTLRFINDEAGARAHIRHVLSLGKKAMVQPYQGRVDERGETGLLFYNGEFSHAFCKAAILSQGESERNGLFVVEEITARTPRADELAVGEKVIELLTSRFGEAPLYARIDMVDGDNGKPLVMEIELAEPSMFFHVAEGSADRYANAILARVAG